MAKKDSKIIDDILCRIDIGMDIIQKSINAQLDSLHELRYLRKLLECQLNVLEIDKRPKREVIKCLRK